MINFLIRLSRHACCSMCARVRKAPTKFNPEEQNVMGKTNICKQTKTPKQLLERLQLCMHHQINAAFSFTFPPVNNEASVLYMLCQVISVLCLYNFRLTQNLLSFIFLKACLSWTSFALNKWEIRFSTTGKRNLIFPSQKSSSKKIWK